MISIEKQLHAILEQQNLIFPKADKSREEVYSTFENAVAETSDTWRVPCTHILYPAASPKEIEHAERQLGFAIPQDLRNLLQLTNGARLFVSPMVWKPEWGPRIDYEGCHILGTNELINVNQTLLKQFHLAFADDPDFRDIYVLNYIAFCDALNGNFHAMQLSGLKQGEIFFLDREGLGRPYYDEFAYMYLPIAKSLRDWLEMIAKTQGREGLDPNMTSL